MFDFLKRLRQKKMRQAYQDCLQTEFAEEFLQTLLNLMGITFALDHDFRKNIANFDGRYQFKTMDGKLTVAAIFNQGCMKVREKVINDPHITITFRNGRALLNFLFSPNQDILGAMLRHDVQTDGNLNYLYKFGFMAKQLQRMLPQP